MTESVGWVWTAGFFLLAIGPLVFVHELGHYLAGRACSVKAEVFSVGFGREILGWTDARGTRWKIGWLPIGGYVKFAGDADASSRPDEHWETLSEEERNQCLPAKKPWQRMIVSAAGPFANFLFAFLVYCGLFWAFGEVVTPAQIGHIERGSVAEAAGFKTGDRLIEIDGKVMTDFNDVRWVVAISPGQTLPFRIERSGQTLTINAAPRTVTDTDKFGNVNQRGMLGIAPAEAKRVDLPFYRVPAVALGETVDLTRKIVDGLAQLVSGRHSASEIGGPLMIAKTSGEVATGGGIAFIGFLAFLSINLGFINLLPIPVLDGGHLVFHAIESVIGRPVSRRIQEIAFTAGLFALMALMVFATFNDLSKFGLFSRIAG